MQLPSHSPQPTTALQLVDAKPTTDLMPLEPEATALVRHLVHSDATTEVKDSRIIALLSNASFMNGSSLKSKPSIWSILENINPTSSPTCVGSEAHGDVLHSVAFSDTSSIMVYSPLFPTQSDFVELAELAPYAEQDAVENSVEDTQEVVARSSWTLMWPFSIWHRQDQTQQGISQTLGNGGPQQQSAEFTQVDADTNSPRIRTRTMRAWVPSSSKISVQAFWWGYRLYLPPPILEILSDKTLEAARRSDMITSALTWFFDRLPVDIFPPPMRYVVMLLQRLTPVVGLIGAGISWYWYSITSHDIGNGITLTATWILPVALIPGTWHERDFPKSPLPNSPIPLPRTRPFSMQSFTSTMSWTTTTDDDIPASAYATPMSPKMFSSSLLPVPDENRVVGLSLASSSTAWSASPPPQLPPPQLPISPPMPTTVLPNSPNSLYFPPNSPTATPVADHFFQYLPSASTSSVPLALNPSTTLPSPRIRTPRFSTRMGSLSFSPSINSNSNSGINATPPHLIIHKNNNIIPPSPPPITPILPSTPIPIPPTPPSDLPPIPPELPLSPKLVKQLLRGPVLQTVPLPDVDDGNNGDGVGGVGVGVGADLDKSSGSGVVGRTTRGGSNLKKKGIKMETKNAQVRNMKTSMSFSPSRRND